MQIKQRVHLPMKLCNQEGILKTQLRKVHSLSSGEVSATPILKSIPSQFSPFIL